MMTLCHELIHIRRHDLVRGWVPAIAERLFFFHPLARLAAREYLTSREAACDAAVVRALDVSPTDYGRMLVRLGVAVTQPAFAAGGSPSSMSSLRRRLEMLQHTVSPETSRRWKWLIAAMVCALIPLHLVARTDAGQQPAPVRQVPEAPAPVAATAVAPAPREAAPRRAAPVEAVPAEAAARAVGPVEPPPAEAAPQAPAGEAARQADLADSQQNLEKSLAELVRGFQDAEAFRQKSTEYALQAELARLTAEEQSREAEMRRITELLNRGLIPSSVAQAARERAEQQLHVARARMHELIARRAQADPSLGGQLEQLTRQVEILAQQLKQVVEQQEQLAAAQRTLAEAAERIRRLVEDTERIRKTLEAK
jgi:hypothetical protein